MQFVHVDWDAAEVLEVFNRCYFQRDVGMAGLVWLGIERPEIITFAGMVEDPVLPRMELIDDVIYCERIALPLLNKRD